MKIELEFPEKLDAPIDEILSHLREKNNAPELTINEVLSAVCKQYIAQEHAKYLME